MNNNKSNLIQSNKLFGVLILLNLIYCVGSGDFDVSVTNILQGTTYYVGFIITWLIALGFYIYSLAQTKNYALARYFLLPISIIIGLFSFLVISPWANYGANIRNVESILGLFLFYLLSFPVLVFLYFDDLVENLKSLFIKVIFVSLALMTLYVLIFYWDIFGYLDWYYIFMFGMLATMIYTLILVNTVFIVFTIYKLIRQKQFNSK